MQRQLHERQCQDASSIAPTLPIKCVPVQYFVATSEKEECAICLNAFEAGDALRVPDCGHRFHAKCLRVCFSSGRPCCPVCRHVVVAQPPASPAEDTDALRQRPRRRLLARLFPSVREPWRPFLDDYARVRRRPGVREPWPFLDDYVP